MLCTLAVDNHVSSSGEPRYMLGHEPVLTLSGEPIVDRKGRRSFVTSAGSGPSVGQASADGVSSAGTRQGGNETQSRIFCRAVSGHCGGRRFHASLRSGKRKDERPNLQVKHHHEHPGLCQARSRYRAREWKSRPEERTIETRNLGFTISPHEECAVEEAVLIIEKHGRQRDGV